MPEVAPERYACERRLGAGAGQRDGEDRVGSEARLVPRAVELDEHPVDNAQVDLGTRYGIGDLAVHRGNRAQDAAAAEARRVAVPALDCLVPAGGGARWDAGDDDLAVRELELRFDGGTPAGVQDLAAANCGDSHLPNASSCESPPRNSSYASRRTCLPLRPG